MDSTLTNCTMDSETSRWKYLFTDLADPRTSEWFLMSNPILMLLILFAYLYFVKICGPKYMKDKEPYQLKRVLRIYNLLQVAANVWMFKEGLQAWSGYNWNCQPIDYSYSEEPIRGNMRKYVKPYSRRHLRLMGVIIHAWACYMFFLNKISDLMDTVFFVLRKKDRQITFLHVFHHTMMPFAAWNGVKYFPGGHGTFVGLVNTFVHILLYSYYYLAAFGPKVQKYLWWKKYLTRIQLIQFCLVFIHSCQLLVLDCDYPKLYVLFTLPNAIFFYYLFADFYKKSYTNEEPKKTQNITNGHKETAKTK